MTGYEDLDEGDEGAREDGGFDDLERAVGGGDSSDDQDDALNKQREEEQSDPATTPAFDYDSTKNAAQYVREETAADLNDAWEYDAKPYLGREIGLENVEKREWQDAVFRFAAENPEAVADLIVTAREEAHGELDEDS